MQSLIVCFGGTFDPVHTGHLAIATAVRDGLHATVRLLPASAPPHKGPPRAGPQQRAEMLALAVAGEAGLEVDRRELGRDGPSYTVDTLRDLRAELGPHVPLAWLVGGDSALQLDRWHRWRELFDHAHVLVVDRPGARVDAATLAAQAPAVHAEVAARWCRPEQLHALPAGGFAELPLDQARPESSTRIREWIAAGDPRWRDWVPAAVAGFITRQRLYGG